MDARRKCNDTLKHKEQDEIKQKQPPPLKNPTYLAFSTLKIFLKARGEIKIFSDKQKLTEFIRADLLYKKY